MRGEKRRTGLKSTIAGSGSLICCCSSCTLSASGCSSIGVACLFPFRSFPSRLFMQRKGGAVMCVRWSFGNEVPSLRRIAGKILERSSFLEQPPASLHPLVPWSPVPRFPDFDLGGQPARGVPLPPCTPCLRPSILPACRSNHWDKEKSCAIFHERLPSLALGENDLCWSGGCERLGSE
ncbi:hypothetical protein B0I37DRAFT_141345 [Chaetomium sp. MPI-CAGE-AT-0009]|nr:hypothetical protein B0I37DRAFT_141345 [Chaetomium sp. MPI-CAGE-AT-0009]